MIPMTNPASPKEDENQLISLIQMLSGQGQQPGELDREDPQLGDTGIPRSPQADGQMPSPLAQLLFQLGMG